jgi:hypothetical protein
MFYIPIPLGEEFVVSEGWSTDCPEVTLRMLRRSLGPTPGIQPYNLIGQLIFEYKSFENPELLKKQIGDFPERWLPVLERLASLSHRVGAFLAGSLALSLTLEFTKREWQ